MLLVLSGRVMAAVGDGEDGCLWRGRGVRRGGEMLSAPRPPGFVELEPQTRGRPAGSAGTGGTVLEVTSWCFGVDLTSTLVVIRRVPKAVGRTLCEDPPGKGKYLSRFELYREGRSEGRLKR